MVFSLPSSRSRYPSGLRIASSSLLSAGHLPSSDIIGQFLSPICYQLTVVGSLAGSIFLQKIAIYFVQFVRLGHSQCPMPPLSCSSCRFFFLSGLLLLIAAILVYIMSCSFMFYRIGPPSLPRPPLCFLFLLQSRVFIARIASCNFQS